MKKAISILLVLIMAIGICIPAYADGSIQWTDYYGVTKSFNLWGEIAPGETKTVSHAAFDTDIVIKMTADREGFYIFDFKPVGNDEADDFYVFVNAASKSIKNGSPCGTRECCDYYNCGSEIFINELDKEPLFYLKAGETIYFEPGSYKSDDILANVTAKYLGTFESLTVDDGTMIFMEEIGRCYYSHAYAQVKFSEGETYRTVVKLCLEDYTPGEHFFIYSFIDEGYKREIKLVVHSSKEFIKKISFPEKFKFVTYSDYNGKIDAICPEYISITDASGNKRNFNGLDSIFAYEGKTFRVEFWFNDAKKPTLEVRIGDIPYCYGIEVNELSFMKNMVRLAKTIGSRIDASNSDEPSPTFFERISNGFNIVNEEVRSFINYYLSKI